jgi:hypothetical protein
MGIELTDQNPRLSRREGGILPIGRALPELEPTKLAKLVAFRPGANIYLTAVESHPLIGDPTSCEIRYNIIEGYCTGRMTASGLRMTGEALRTRASGLTMTVGDKGQHQWVIKN